MNYPFQISNELGIETKFIVSAVKDLKHVILSEFTKVTDTITGVTETITGLSRSIDHLIAQRKKENEAEEAGVLPDYLIEFWDNFLDDLSDAIPGKEFVKGIVTWFKAKKCEGE